MNNSLVSIILPVFNGETFIERTIKSVISQTYPSWELIIVDDCSIDNSVNLVNELAQKDNRIKLIRLDENSGAAIARNKAIENASGSFIAFLDADDSWEPEKLEIQLYEMQKLKCDFSHTSYYLCDESSRRLCIQTTCKKYLIYNDLIKYNWIGTSTVIFNSKNLGKHFMPNIRNRQDWALWLSLIKFSGKALFISKPLTRYTLRNNSISSNKFRLLKYHWLIYRQIENFNIFYSAYHLVRNLYYHIKKNKFIKTDQ